MAREPTAPTFGPGAAPTPTPPTSEGPRYRLGEVLGRGGFGTVFRATDTLLGRPVAMKVLHPHLGTDPGFVSRFRDEAQRVAGLQHPGVVPVHDVGTLPDGRLFFTMREVEGRTLDAMQAAGELEERRAVDRLRRVAHTVAYAHARGVVHLDLKPANLMCGAFAEVWVLDWGIAELVGALGGRRGTPGFMAPELAQDGGVGPAADVFSFGICLQRLTGSDPDLQAWVARCTASDPADRPTMEAVVDGLEAWLDGSLRQARAQRMVAEAAPRQAAAAAARAEAHRLEERARALLREAKSPDERVAAWAVDDAARQASIQAAVLDAEAVRHLTTALGVADLAEAHLALREHHVRRLIQAERDGDAEAVATEAVLVQGHDVDGAAAAFLRGDGRLRLDVQPAAMVDVHRMVREDRRLKPVPWLADRPTPLDETLPMGSYLLTLRVPGRPDVPYPVAIDRQGAWSVPPVPIPARWPEGSRYVAEGPFHPVTRTETAYPIPDAPVWVEGFFIDTHPVTNGEWLAFLHHLHDAEGPEAAAERVPHLAGGPPIWPRGPDGRFGLGRDAQGHLWTEDMPVVWVDWHDAVAFAAWRSARTGWVWRLPAELEWMKAARGADRRIYPWGDHIAPEWSRHLGSPGPPGPSGVGDFPDDLSVYGVRHLAGQVQCWLLDPFPDGARVVDGRSVPAQHEAPRRHCAGGSWSHAAAAVRIDQRKAAPVGARLDTIGVRLVAALEP
jgi:eukaryotic-like serine/threonine-protein kinase